MPRRPKRKEINLHQTLFDLLSVQVTVLVQETASVLAKHSDEDPLVLESRLYSGLVEVLQIKAGVAKSFAKR